MLTQEDCLEIYYVLQDEALQTAIGIDGELLADGSFEPTPAQWSKIRASLRYKLANVKHGFYGTDRVTREWAQHLSEILKAIVETEAAIKARQDAELEKLRDQMEASRCSECTCSGGQHYEGCTRHPDRSWWN